MLPDEQFSGDAVPQTPWQPLVWRDGPDALVASAQAQLWQDSNEIMSGALGPSSSSMAMSGAETQPENESEQLIDGSTPGDGPSHDGDVGAGQSRAKHWNSMMQDLRRDEPLASWSTGQHDGPANPAP